MRLRRKVRRFKRLFIGGAYGLFLSLFLIIYSLHISLPCLKKPLLFYNSEKGKDLNLLLKKAIASAQMSIILRTYGLTDPVILSLLKKKAQQGISISLYYDQRANPDLAHLNERHFHFYPMKGKGLIHEKIWIIDETLVFIGSANVTPSSLRMHENLMVGMHAPFLAKTLAKKRPSALHISLGEHQIHYYSLPSQDGLNAVLTTLDQAKKKVSLSFFTFTHPLIGEKLIELYKKGIKIDIKLDKGSAEGSSKKIKDTLESQGISIQTSQGIQLFHHKWAIIDKKTHIIGSANWTRAAFDKNQDLILIITSN